MKKLIPIILFFFIGISNSIFAAYVKDYPLTVKQPNGKELHCFVTGDEFYNWMHDANGFTILKHPKTSYYVYAQLDGDKLIATNYIPGEVNPEKVGLKPYSNIPAEKVEEKRISVLDKMNIIPSEETSSLKKGATGQTLNNLVVYVKFSNQDEFSSDTLLYWNMFNKAENNANSLYNYFHKTSYGKVSVLSSFYPKTGDSKILSYTDPHPRSYYQAYDENTNTNGYADQSALTDREQELLNNAILHIREQVPTDLNLDYNDDGYVDNICFVIKGNVDGWTSLLWPHRYKLFSAIEINGKKTRDYNFQLENMLVRDGASVLIHEMYHSFGAPDLYRYNNNAKVVPVGRWDLMGYNNKIPQSMCAYYKYKYGGWVEEIPEITENGFYTIKTVWNKDKCIYKIASKKSSTEFYTIEYRNKSADYFDSELPGSGLLMYRINTKAFGNREEPDEVYIFRLGASSTKESGDITYAPFSEEAKKTVFSNQSDPPCFLSTNTLDDIFIRNISKIGDSMTFEVVFPTKASPNFNASETLITTGSSVDFVNTTAGYADSYLWTFENGIPATSVEKNPTGIVYNNPGKHKVTLSVMNEYGDALVEKGEYITVSDTEKPIVSINVYDTIVGCSSDTVQFYGIATVSPETWKWNFAPNTYNFVDGTTEDSQNPKVIFLENTSYNATLTVTNKNGSTSLIKENIITIKVQDNSEFVENFENIKVLNSGWKIVTEKNATPWQLFYTSDGESIGQSIGIKFFELSSSIKQSSFITPAFKVLNDKYKLSFKHAYCLKNIYSTDSLNVYISTDCGVTWIKLGGFSEKIENDACTYNFATREITQEDFIPTNATDWCTRNNCISFDLSEYIGSESVKFKFEAIRYGGNNLYIDNIAVGDKYVSIPHIEKAENNVILYPNPNTGSFVLSTNMQNVNADVIVYNLQGNIVYKSVLKGMKEQYNLSHLPKGIYFVKIVGENISQYTKFIKQ